MCIDLNTWVTSTRPIYTSCKLNEIRIFNTLVSRNYCNLNFRLECTLPFQKRGIDSYYRHLLSQNKFPYIPAVVCVKKSSCSAGRLCNRITSTYHVKKSGKYGGEKSLQSLWSQVLWSRKRHLEKAPFLTTIYPPSTPPPPILACSVVCAYVGYNGCKPGRDVAVSLGGRDLRCRCYDALPMAVWLPSTTVYLCNTPEYTYIPQYTYILAIHLAIHSLQYTGIPRSLLWIFLSFMRKHAASWTEETPRWSKFATE